MMRNYSGRLLLALILSLSFVGGAAAQFQLQGEAKAAFLYFSQKNDGGWSESHERARANTSKALGMEIAYIENVDETVEAVRQVVDTYISQGFNIIVGTSYGYGAGLLEAANANPDVAFVNVGGDTFAKNLETVYARTYQAWYLAGMAAGAVSKSNKIGIVAGFPVSVVNWDINAYTLGARAMNPDIEVIATYTNTWYDPTTEKKSAQTMLEQGADVIACNMSSAAVVIAAEAAGAWSIGFQNNMAAAGPERHLTSVVFNWDRYYTPLLKRIIEGEWTSEGLPLSGLETGLADITPLNEAIPLDKREKIIATRQRMMNGSFNPYTGPVQKQNGDVAVAAGETITDGGLWTMDYLVKGVVATLRESD